jgi:hypothetical protein
MSSERISTADFLSTVNGILKNRPPQTVSRDALAELLSEHYDQPPHKMGSKLNMLISSLKRGVLYGNKPTPPNGWTVEQQQEVYKRLVARLLGGGQGPSMGELPDPDDFLL